MLVLVYEISSFIKVTFFKQPNVKQVKFAK